MKVKILNSLSYQVFPITDGMIDIDEKLLNEIGKTKQFDNDGSVIDYLNAKGKIVELKQKLQETDYLAIKHFEGYLTDYEYEPIKLQRQAWRDEINQLEKLI